MSAPADRRALRPVLLAMLAALLSVALLGCGEDSDDTTAGTDETSTTAADLTKVTITIPLPTLSFLSLDVAEDQGYFEEEGLDVEVVTLQGPTPAHVSAVLAGEAWGFVGGLEHVLLANARGSDLRAVAAVNGPPSSWLVSPTRLDLGDDPAAALRGKRIAVNAAGRSPHIAFGLYLDSIGLDPATDVTLIEGDEPARAAAVASGQADLALVSEPLVSQGMIDGLWGEPILDLGAFKPYILSSLNVPLKTIEDDPETVKRVVRALVRGAQYIYDEPEAALAIAKDALGETTSPEALEMAFARLLAGDGWSIDGRFAEGGLEALTELATSQAEGMELDPDKAFDDQFLDD